MSESMNAHAARKDFRRQLLTTVSSLALLGFVCGAGKARAADDDTDRPTVWVELGGQLEQLSDGEERFAPPFLLTMPRSSVQTISPLSVERPLQYSTGGQGKISFEPDGSNWVFSASVRYGRSNGNKHVHQQSYPASLHQKITGTFGTINGGSEPPLGAKFSDIKAQTAESDAVVDFQAGKDVGLGMFGGSGSSVFDLGVRFAQFSSKSNIAIKSDPDWHFQYRYLSFPSIGVNHEKFSSGQVLHTNIGNAATARSFRGVGPSVSWNATAPVLGNPQKSQIDFDWGMNAALLFGRQKASTQHQTTVIYLPYQGKRYQLYRNPPHPTDRVRSVIVPNVGAFAGLSLRFPNAKVSLGYRGDFFFGAMDGGIDARKTYDRNFYGPFATISVGL